MNALRCTRASLRFLLGFLMNWNRPGFGRGPSRKEGGGDQETPDGREEGRNGGRREGGEVHEMDVSSCHSLLHMWLDTTVLSKTLKCP